MESRRRKRRRRVPRLTLPWWAKSIAYYLGAGAVALLFALGLTGLMDPMRR
jgi:hypothetical protein